MRKITPESFLHNGTPWRGALLLGIVSLVVAVSLASCSCDPGTDHAREKAPASMGPDCPLEMDTSAWDAFTDLADRIATGEKVSQQELDAFGDLAPVALWRQSLQPGSPSAIRVGNWLEAVFWDELGRQGQQKRNSDRETFRRSFDYSLAHRNRIDERLAVLTTGASRCALDSLTRFWVEGKNLPETVVVHFLPAKAEIRIWEGELLVDTGVVGAMNTGQVTRQMASLMYRKYQFVPGDNPIEVDGEKAVANSFRVLMNEGVAGWIEQSTELYFDTEHPELYKIHIIPEDFFEKAQEAVDLFNKFLGPMLDDPAVMIRNGQPFARQLAAMNAYSQTGFAMGAVIASRLGEDQLRDASRSVASFLAAYQEAALLNPDPAPYPGAPGTELHMTVKALEPTIFPKLEALLERNFLE